MGRYDDIDPEQVRRQMVRVARLILRMDEENRLLREAPRLQKLLGDLRQRLFAYEVRCAADLGKEEGGRPKGAEGEATSEDDELLSESMRVVQEALDRQIELVDELEGRHRGSDPEDDLD